ncbi:MAG: iron ABC transporter permease [Bacteroidetes bacterium]|nr:iron ABC transporter permease [Bacteroidota bacterium]MBI3482144.1 iron ABC transporter permease [Bacteroidota bacterium]
MRSSSVKFLFLIFLLLFLFLTDVVIGGVSIPISEVLGNLFSKSESTLHTILWQFRLPKAITCVLAGASLACSGLLMQTLFRNPLAGPDVLGLSSGASLAVGILVLLGRGFDFTFNEWSLAFAAGGGGILVLLLMLGIARSVRDNASLLIIGLMLAAATSSIMSVMQFVSRAEDLQFYVLWTMGSVGNTGWNEIGVIAIISVVGVNISLLLLKPLNSWLLGENYARSLGVNVDRSRLWIVIAAGLMTGAITAFCGPIAFVGLAVPHLARLVMQTTNHKILLPTVICGGAILLLFCDFISQLMSDTQALPLNALTSLIGAPVVIWQVMKFKKVSV